MAIVADNEIIGFIGAGNMAEALVRGLIASGAAKAKQIRAADPSEERRRRFAGEFSVETTDDNAAVARAARVLVLAVKPGFVSTVGKALHAESPKDQIVISIAAGVPLAVLAEYWKKQPLARVMPNTPALVGAGASAVYFHNASEGDRILAKALLSAVGKVVVEVPKEELLDVVTGLSGSGPAYVFEFIEALSDGGVLMGLDRSSALRLAAATVEGAAKMVLETGEHPGVLKDKVSSPGGTTIAGLAALEARGFRSSAIEAVRAATTRSRELAEEAEKKD